MDRPSEKTADGWGVLAIGRSQLWQIDIDESLERENEWCAQIEGPNVYLAFQLHDLKVIPEMLRFLQKRLPRSTDDSLTIGKFGQLSVSLVWDDEHPDRCFLVIGPQARSTLRLSLRGDDIEMLIEALRQVAEDLPQSASGCPG